MMGIKDGDVFTHFRDVFTQIYFKIIGAKEGDVLHRYK